MIKLLIVDDEPIILEGLKNLDWRMLGYEVIGTATNGVTAVALSEDNIPDVILSDISMPKMNGILMIDIMKKKHPEIEFIFLTGFDDFQYTKEAIKLGAFDYILKPLVLQKLVEVMTGLKQHIIEKKIKKDALLNLLKKEQQLDTIKHIEMLFSKWDENSMETEAALKKLDVSSHSKIILISSRILNAKNIHVGNKLLYLLKDKYRETFLNYDFKIYNKTSDNLLYSLIVSNNWVDDEDYTEIIYNFCSEIYNFFESELEELLKITLSDTETGYNAKKNLKFQVDNLQNGLKYSNDYGVFSYSGYSKNLYDFWIYDQHLKKIVFDSISTGNESATKENIKNWLSTIHTETKLDNIKLHLNAFLLEFLEKKADCSESIYDAEANISSMYRNIVNSIESINLSQSLNEIDSTFNNVMSILVANKNPHCRKNKKGNLVDCVIEYIETMYFMDISLEDISEKLGVSKPYISKIVKEHTGRNFIEILISKRLRKATELLKTSNIKVSSVSESVGYSDVSYFIRAFKKEFGITPSEYRRLI